MAKKTKFWLFLGFYLLNCLFVCLWIAYWTENIMVEVLLAVYLLILTGFFSYANRKRR